MFTAICSRKLYKYIFPLVYISVQSSITFTTYMYSRRPLLSGVIEDSSLLGCDSTSLVSFLETFRTTHQETKHHIPENQNNKSAFVSTWIITKLLAKHLLIPPNNYNCSYSLWLDHIQVLLPIICLHLQAFNCCLT
jgi:hypothetical protein